MKDKDKRIENLHRLCFNNNPNCIIELEGISPLADDRTQVHSTHFLVICFILNKILYCRC